MTNIGAKNMITEFQLCSVVFISFNVVFWEMCLFSPLSLGVFGMFIDWSL